MAKAKEYIGESYTDSLGQQWRWDGGKETYVRNYGTSPMASIKRSWDQKIVPAGTTLKNAIQNRNPEGITSAQSRGIVKDTKSEAASWFQRAIEDPSISDQVRTPLIQANLNMLNAFELEDTDTMTWAQSIGKNDGNQDLTEIITKVEKENKKQEVEPEFQPNQYRESTIEQGQETTSKIGKIGDKNWEADTRWSGETGNRKLSTPTAIQKDLQKAGFKDEQLIKLMEKNQQFQADRPKVTDLLKIFKK